MTLDQAKKHFGSQAHIARALGLAPPSISEWKSRGIPGLRQLQLEQLTGGKLKAASAVKQEFQKLLGR